MTLSDWKKLSRKNEKKIYKLLLPYYNLNYNKVCDRLYSYSHRKKYVDDCIRLYHYLTLTCGQNKYEMKGTDLVDTKDVVFNPIKDGIDLLHIIVRMMNDEKTKDRIYKLLDNDHKEYVYKNAMIMEMNNTIKNDYGLDILQLYSKKKKILTDYEHKYSYNRWLYP